MKSHFLVITNEKGHLYSVIPYYNHHISSYFAIYFVEGYYFLTRYKKIV